MTGAPSASARVDELAAAHADDLIAFASLVLEHRAGAEEVLIASLVDAARDPACPPAGLERRTHLLRIARRRAVAAERRSDAVDPLPASTAPGDPADPFPPHALASAMAALPARARALVALSVLLELPGAEISAVMEERPQRVATELRSALARLRTLLEGEGMGTEIEVIGDVE